MRAVLMCATFTSPQAKSHAQFLAPFLAVVRRVGAGAVAAQCCARERRGAGDRQLRVSLRTGVTQSEERRRRHLCSVAKTRLSRHRRVRPRQVRHRHPIRAFADAWSAWDNAVFFYAGHGLQVSEQNYLVAGRCQVGHRPISTSRSCGWTHPARDGRRSAKANVLFVDACRDNPLARTLANAMGTRSSPGRSRSGREHVLSAP